MLNHEAEFFVERDIFNSIGFKITDRPFLLEFGDIKIHQRRADSLSLSSRSYTDGPEMNVRLLRIKVAPSSKPLNEFRHRLAHRLQQCCSRIRNLLRRRQTVRPRAERNIAAERTVV